LPTELADWVRGMLLLGQDAGGDPVAVLVDADGQIQVLLRGESAPGTPRTVKVDASGQLYTVLRGAGDVDVAVDDDGFLSTVLKGVDAGTLRTVLVDESGRMYARMVAYDGSDMRSVRVDAQGRIIMVPYGVTAVSGDVDVTQTDSAREVQGADGATLRTLVVDANGQLIMVPRGQSGNYMAINEDGYMTAVLKGVLDDALTTIAVDAQGRIEAFILDAEDQWGSRLKVGNSELAARLGSPVSYDWRGQVLAYNTFGAGMGNLYAIEYGAGASAEVDVDYALTDGYCLKLLGGSDGDMKVTVQGIVGRNPSARIGVAIAFSPVYVCDYFIVWLRIRDATTRHIGGLKYDPGSYLLSYYGDDAAWHALGNYYYVAYPYAFSFMKLVIDTSTDKYVRALFQATEIDLSAHDLETDALGFTDGVEVFIEVFSTSGHNYGIRLDRYVITVNEP